MGTPEGHTFGEILHNDQLCSITPQDMEALAASTHFSL